MSIAGNTYLLIEKIVARCNYNMGSWTVDLDFCFMDSHL
jgi:hypothetical protein